MEMEKGEKTWKRERKKVRRVPYRKLSRQMEGWYIHIFLYIFYFCFFFSVAGDEEILETGKGPYG